MFGIVNYDIFIWFRERDREISYYMYVYVYIYIYIHMRISAQRSNHAAQAIFGVGEGHGVTGQTPLMVAAKSYQRGEMMSTCLERVTLAGKIGKISAQNN